MDNVRPAYKTATLGLDQGYRPLHVTHMKVGDYDCLQTLWRPSEEELSALNAGALVELNVLGSGHPPVLLNVTDPPDGSQPLSPRDGEVQRSETTEQKLPTGEGDNG